MILIIGLHGCLYISFHSQQKKIQNIIMNRLQTILDLIALNLFICIVLCFGFPIASSLVTYLSNLRVYGNWNQYQIFHHALSLFLYGRLFLKVSLFEWREKEWMDTYLSPHVCRWKAGMNAQDLAVKDWKSFS